MQGHRKVYPGGQAPIIRWLSILLVVLAAIIVASGLIGRRKNNEIVKPLPTVTPFPLEESFDETVESCEWALPAVEWYALQLGAFDGEASARELAETYQRRGAAGYLWQEERWRVLAAIYANENDARSVRQQLLQQHNVESYLFRISLPSIQVSIHGMRGQIEILQAAFVHSAELIEALEASSLALDRGETTVGEQMQTLTGLNEQMQLVRLRLHQRFAQPRDPCVTGLITLFDDFGTFCAGLDASRSEAAFGACIKHQTIRSLDLLRQVYDILGHT